MPIPTWIPILSLFISFIALYFTFKKDAHRIRLRHNKGRFNTSDFISINNDSSFPVHISSVGYVDEDGGIKWLERICEAKENKSHSFPVEVGARSTYQGIIIGNQVSLSEKHGYCVQLECGRTFAVSVSLPIETSIKLASKSLASRLSSGRFGFEKNDVHMSQY